MSSHSKEAGAQPAISLSRSLTTLGDILTDAVDLVSDSLSEQQINLITWVDETTRLMYLDKARIVQVLTILLSNSALYCAKNSELKLNVFVGEGGHTEFSVSGGLGCIAPLDEASCKAADVEVEQLSTSPSFLQDKPNLQLAHEIVHQHQGEIWLNVESGSAGEVRFFVVS